MVMSENTNVVMIYFLACILKNLVPRKKIHDNDDDSNDLQANSNLSINNKENKYHINNCWNNAKKDYNNLPTSDINTRHANDITSTSKESYDYELHGNKNKYDTEENEEWERVNDYEK